MVRTAIIGAVVLLVSSAAYSQSADPSGHWAGSVNMPTTQTGIEVDFARSASGQFSGTMSVPSQKLTRLPLSKVDVNGASIAFEARTDQRFLATLSADGNTMSGAYAIEDYLFAFTMTRMGNARIDAPPTSAPIGKALEGTWNGTFAANGTRMRVVLTLANHANGTSTGSVINLDEGSLTIPIATIAQKGRGVTLRFEVLQGSYAATLNADDTELTGTWTESGMTVPMTFTREVSGR